jgi:hypothetical protein
VGKRVVFRETGFLVPAVITEISAEANLMVKMEAIDGIVLQPVPKPRPFPRTIRCGTAWNYLDVTPDEWSGYCWRIFLNEAGCDAVLRLCWEKTGLDPKALFRLADLIRKHPAIKIIPDTPEALLEQILNEKGIKRPWLTGGS